MARDNGYRNVRLLLDPSDIDQLAELRSKLQKLEPMRAITDSGALRKALRIANGLLAEEPRRGPKPKAPEDPPTAS